jgi:hypothetical protein
VSGTGVTSGGDALHDLFRCREFVRVDRVPHPGVDPLGGVCAQTGEGCRSLPHALEWYVKVRIAAPDERGRPGEISGVQPSEIGPRRTDHPPAENENASVSLGMACGELGAQTRSLGETTDYDPGRGYVGADELLQQARDNASADDRYGSFPSRGAMNRCGYHTDPAACGMSTAMLSASSVVSDSARGTMLSADAPLP